MKAGRLLPGLLVLACVCLAIATAAGTSRGRGGALFEHGVIPVQAVVRG